MPPEPTVRRKKSDADTRPAPDGDHRKRRRNRTTQSCLNCHTSKRMCDRKRPCGRCTQLGLTGLCVYEVDDPSRRTGDPQDESARLLKRVAELEGVIREMKNKPHPRWVQTTLAKVAQDAEKWHERMNDANASAAVSSSASPSEMAPLPPQSSTPSPTRTASSSPRSIAGSLSDRCEAPHALPYLTGSPTFHSIHPQQHLAPDASPAPALEHSHHSSVSTPSSSPSPVIMSPVEPTSAMPVSVVGSSDFDLTSIFSSYSPQTSNEYEESHSMAYPEMIHTNKAAAAHSPTSAVSATSDENPYFHNVFPAPRHEHGHCGCLHDATSYNVLLELSVRLRKAAQVLANSSNHRLGLTCPVNQRVTELDHFASNALTNISCSIDTLSPTSLLRSHHASTASLMAAHHPVPQYASPTGPALPNNLRPIAPASTTTTAATTPSAITTPGLHNGWDLSAPMANYATAQTSSGADDSFMSWERLRAQ